ncbi:MAG: hypothetical protein AAFP89_25555 [Bacteroidota bacterium]
MAYIKIVSQSDPHDGKFQRLRRQGEPGANADSVQRIHDCTWYKRDIERVLNQEGKVIGVTMIPIVYIELDTQGNETSRKVGQSMVAVEENVTSSGPIGRPITLHDQVGDLMAASCDPILDIFPDVDMEKRYYEEV